MTETARRLLRYSCCPGSARMAKEDVEPIFFLADIWQSYFASRRPEKWTAPVREFHKNVMTATNGRKGLDRELWLTGCLAGISELKFASEKDVLESTCAGNWCEWCPARGECPTRAAAIPASE